MIIGMLGETERIEGVHRYFKEVFEYIRSHDMAAAEPGRIDIDGENAWISVDEVCGREKGAALLETHNRYIDIQVPLRGTEGFGWSPRALMRCERAPYDEAKDITFYADEVHHYFRLSCGEFVVFFPEDAHAPCIGEGEMKKVVAKIRV